MKDFFERVVVVTLERRHDRLDAFMKRLPANWPFRDVEVVKAIDGRLCKHPEWWRQGGGAWGCYKSHANILEDALNNGINSVLIFEDDATFCSNFSDAAARYLEALPGDWVQAYLGGQHLKKAKVLEGNPLVVQAQNINRTHAYAVRGREGITTLYRWLNETQGWVNRNHIDHHYGRLHKAASAGYYAPAQWLCGQASGHSDISWKETGERWWTRAGVAEEARDLVVHETAPITNCGQFVAVVGLHRSGSSCIAMMLHKLGVNMGDKLVGWESRNGGGGEAANLARLCERAARFPAAGFTHPPDQIRRNLRTWVNGRIAKAKKKGIRVGGKYPHLCAMGDMLKDICGRGLRVVHCNRPLAESIESLQRRSRTAKGWLNASDEQCERVQQWLWEEKTRFISSLPKNQVLTVDYADVLSRPALVVDQMAEFLGLHPTEEQCALAAAHVKKGARN